MAMRDPHGDGVDPAHILAICEHVAASGGHRPAGYVTATSDGVRVRVSSVRTARAMREELILVGYDTDLVRPGRHWRLLVTGWSAERLESRLAAMRATQQRLRSGETATAAAVIDRYRHLSARLPVLAASATAISEVERDIRTTVAARCGVFAPRDPAILPADVGNALRLRTIWALEHAIVELIERHLRVARRALAQFCSLRRLAADDWAKDAAVRRATDVPPPPIGPVVNGPPAEPPAPRRPRPDAPGCLATGVTGRAKPEPGLDFPAPVTDAVTAAARTAARRHIDGSLGRGTRTCELATQEPLTSAREQARRTNWTPRTIPTRSRTPRRRGFGTPSSSSTP
jgi:hypothetical protein